MPCFSPLTGYRSKTVNPSGKRSIVFSPEQGFTDRKVEVPCGQCIGCRLEYSRQWAIRCVHESSLYTFNIFITLTYDEDSLPPFGSLDKKHFQDFMKRFRKRFKGYDPVVKDDGDVHYPIRYYHCGEYGEKNGRPHYHAIIFNFRFPDQVLLYSNSRGNNYDSDILRELWPFGRVHIGDVTFDSAAYVARYCTKKITGEWKHHNYQIVREEDGEVIGEVLPEYSTMSRRPGIGKTWFDKYKKEIYNSDSVIINGHEVRPPKYYDNQFELEVPDGLLSLKKERKRLGKKYDEGTERLRVKENVTKKKLATLTPRKL